MRWIFFVLTYFCFFPLNSQIKEGYLRFDVEVISLDTAFLSLQTAKLMRDSRMMLFFDENRSRVDFKLGNYSATSMRIDFKKDKGISLIANTEGRFAQKASIKQLMLNSESGKLQQLEGEVMALPEFKKILGYNCQKYILHHQGKNIIYWCTSEIELTNEVKGLINPRLPYIPLEFSVIENNFKFIYKLTDISFNLENKAHIFSIEPPEGYFLLPNQ